ncbi:MAG: Molybdopterin molybdenumtransferase [Promethearchaeota archaeon]|nr:MAG: Molybdopterin molybdenumtransferase [Candidatus Lokiarchaeota archaeon]
MVERLRKIGFATLTSVEEATEKMLSNINHIQSEEVDITISFRRITANDIKSRIAVPSFDRSAMDGYAVFAEDTFGASPQNPKKVQKVGTIEIGEVSSRSLRKGEAIRISTGAAIPKDANAVVKIEDTEEENNEVTIYNALTPGKNVSKRGEDIKPNKIIIEKGVELRAEHIALLSSQGIQSIPVKKKPKISVFSTGDELRELGEPLGQNQIYNSNTPMIANLVNVYGGEVILQATLKDNKKLIENHLLKSIESSDIVIFTGGTSVGTQDYLPEVVGEHATILTHGVAMRPGEPILIAHKENTMIFCLPGTPVAAYVGFLKFTGPALRSMMDAKKLDIRQELPAIIEKDIPVSHMGYLHHLRVYLEKKEETIIAKSVRLKGSGILSSLTQSDGIVEISKEREGLKAGERVIVKLSPK